MVLCERGCGDPQPDDSGVVSTQSPAQVVAMCVERATASPEFPREALAPGHTGLLQLFHALTSLSLLLSPTHKPHLHFENLPAHLPTEAASRKTSCPEPIVQLVEMLRSQRKVRRMRFPLGQVSKQTA